MDKEFTTDKNRIAAAITPQTVQAKRIGPTLTPDRSRVLMRPFYPVRKDIARRIIARVMALPDEEAVRLLYQVLGEFENRHEHVEQYFRRRFMQVQRDLDVGQEISPERQALIGSYFTHEYSPESAALFNPSIVPHPDQSGLPAGCAPFHPEPAGHGRRAHFLHHVSRGRRQRAASHHAHAARAVCDGAGARAQRGLREGALCPQTSGGGRAK